MAMVLIHGVCGTLSLMMSIGEILFKLKSIFKLGLEQAWKTAKTGTGVRACRASRAVLLYITQPTN